MSADRSVNAFATGSHIVVHQGLLAYYGDPVGYLKSVSPMLLLARRLNEVRAIFSWQRDGPSLDFILAHEAAHNLMAHTDERFVEALGRQLEELASDARAQRQALANGKGGPGFRHYLGTALARFLSHFPAAQYNVAQEEGGGCGSGGLAGARRQRPKERTGGLGATVLAAGRSPSNKLVEHLQFTAVCHSPQSSSPAGRTGAQRHLLAPERAALRGTHHLPIGEAAGGITAAVGCDQRI